MGKSESRQHLKRKLNHPKLENPNATVNGGSKRPKPDSTGEEKVIMIKNADGESPGKPSEQEPDVKETKMIQSPVADEASDEKPDEAKYINQNTQGDEVDGLGWDDKAESLTKKLQNVNKVFKRDFPGALHLTGVTHTLERKLDLTVSEDARDEFVQKINDTGGKLSWSSTPESMEKALRGNLK
jgi:hypothetical protein